MPNWCRNFLIILTHSNETASMIREELQGQTSYETGEQTPISFHKFVPMPQELRNPRYGIFTTHRDEWQAERDRNFARYGHADWYLWAYEHWGPKFEVIEEQVYDISVAGRSVGADFKTAWVPPRPFAQTLSRRFPLTRVGLAYDEDGANIGGFDIFDNGTAVASVEGNANWVEENSWPDLLTHEIYGMEL